MQNHNKMPWSALSGIDFQKDFSLGLGYANQFKQKYRIHFVLQNKAEFCNDGDVSIMESPLWYNKHLINGVNFAFNTGIIKKLGLYLT